MTAAVRIPLSGGRVDLKVRTVLIDAADHDLVAAYSWSWSAGYARCWRLGMAMHRLIMDPGPGLVVDHINGDGLDNRRVNLRLATRSQNQMNRRSHIGSRRIKGVSCTGARWRAQIMVRGETHKLGIFDSEEEAGRAYDVAARALHGEFARLNFPEPHELGAIDGTKPFWVNRVEPERVSA